MNWFFDLMSNQFLITSLSSWFVAQVLKVIIHWYIHKELNITRLIGDGGMPSGHSATVSSLCTLCGLVYGFGSVEFAISAIFAVVVCHDAMGVRHETGKQAILLNELIKSYSDLAAKMPQITLKEFVGHTPTQVAAGIAIGIANAFFMHYIVY